MSISPKTLRLLLGLYVSLLTLNLHAQNQVLYLDGDGDYVKTLNNDGLNAIDSQLTIEAWTLYV